MPVVRGKTIKVLYSAEEIAHRNREIAEAIAASGHEDLLVISILKGSFVFAADLIRALHECRISPEVEFISISSYGQGTTPGNPTILRDVETPVSGRNVLLIDDILESGGTLAFTRALMLERGAKTVSIAVLLDKSSKRREKLEADHAGFVCPDKFVVGYGMDVGHAFRELPYVGEVVSGT